MSEVSVFPNRQRVLNSPAAARNASVMLICRLFSTFKMEYGRHRTVGGKEKLL